MIALDTDVDSRMNGLGHSILDFDNYKGTKKTKDVTKSKFAQKPLPFCLLPWSLLPYHSDNFLRSPT